MPRPPKFPHPLRTVRKVLGKSQVQFGAMVGVAAVTIRKIEGDKLKMSERLARRIHLAVGVSSAELLKGKHGKAISGIGEPFDKEFCARWQKRLSVPASQLAKEWTENFAFWIGILLEAASETGRIKLQGIHRILSQTLESLVDDFNLGPQVKRILEPYKQPFIEKGKTTLLETGFNAGTRPPVPTEERTPIWAEDVITTEDDDGLVKEKIARASKRRAPR